MSLAQTLSPSICTRSKASGITCACLKSSCPSTDGEPLESRDLVHGFRDHMKGEMGRGATRQEKIAGLTEASHATPHLLRGALDVRQDMPAHTAVAHHHGIGLFTQRSVNHGPWAKSSPLPIPTSQVLMVPSQTYLFTLSSFAMAAELRSDDRPYGLQSLTCFLYAKSLLTSNSYLVCL